MIYFSKVVSSMHGWHIYVNIWTYKLNNIQMFKCLHLIKMVQPAVKFCLVIIYTFLINKSH